MIHWLVALATAAKPDSVDLDDLDTWEARARDLVEGPSGCWDLSGSLETRFAAYTPPSLWSRAERRDYAATGSFEGRFRDGRWESFLYDLKVDGEDGSGVEVPLFPMMGKIDQEVVKRRDEEAAEGEGNVGVSVGSSGGEALNLLDKVLEEIAPATTIAYAEWREGEGGVALYQDLPLSGGRNPDVVTLTTFFPKGEPKATKLDAVFPKRLRVGEGLVRATVFDAQMHLRGQPDDSGVLPALESVSLGFGALGFTVGYEQKLTYTRAVTCAPAETP